jgi:hypothetical protein
MLLTSEISKRLVADPKLSTKEYTSITPDAARILADGYRHRTSPLVGAVGRFVTESQLDLSGLTALDAESATALAEWGCDDGAFIMTLDLSGLTQLTPDLATALAAWRPALEHEDGGCGLLLDGVISASVETLAVLAGWEPSCISATLSLNGLKVLDMAQAKAIRGWSGAGAFSQLLFRGVTEIGYPAAAELAQWTGEQLALGLGKLTPEVAGALASFNGIELELGRLTEIDIVAARKLFNTNVEGSSDLDSPGLEILDLGSNSERLKGITPEVADWITDMRVAGIEVQLSKLTELSVYANCTFLSKKSEPETISLYLGGKDGIFFVHRIYCPFCAKLVGEPGDFEHDIPWAKQWKIDVCKHLISVVGNNEPHISRMCFTSRRQ